MKVTEQRSDVLVHPRGEDQTSGVVHHRLQSVDLITGQTVQLSSMATAPTKRPATAGLLLTLSDEYHVTGVRRRNSLMRSLTCDFAWRRPSRRRFRDLAQRMLVTQSVPTLTPICGS